MKGVEKKIISLSFKAKKVKHKNLINDERMPPGTELAFPLPLKLNGGGPTPKVSRDLM